MTNRAIVSVSPEGNRKGFDFHAIERAVHLQPSTKIKYKKEIQNLIESGVNPLDVRALQNYAGGLVDSRRAFLKAALRLMTIDLETALKSSATAENIGSVQAGVYRLEAMRSSIGVRKHVGMKAHTWLDRDQVTAITALCQNDLEGQRDWIVLSLILGAGLRRAEAANVTFDALKRQPSHGKMRDVLQVLGKGSKNRVVPISAFLASRIRAWRDVVGGGRILRSLGKNKKLKARISEVSIYNLVHKYGVLIGVPTLAPHDLRRTWAQIGYESGIPITQISQLLGHASIETTKRYLNLTLDLDTTISDFVPLAKTPLPH